MRPSSRTIEELGVVAVIRMHDPAKLRAVVDALADGGVRALEVTMTVPGAVELIEELAPTLPSTILLGAGTVTDASDGARGDRRRRAVRRRPGVSPRRDGRVSRARRAPLPGCFSPTEILDAHEPAPTSSRCFRRPRSGRSTSRTCARRCRR